MYPEEPRGWRKCYTDEMGPKSHTEVPRDPFSARASFFAQEKSRRSRKSHSDSGFRNGSDSPLWGYVRLKAPLEGGTFRN